MESKTVAFDTVVPEDLVIVDGKPPIIFLHGMTSERSTWRNVIRPIASATGRKAYAFDARNHGDSFWSDEMSYQLLQEDLLKFMDGLPAPKAVLIGHSMGGRTAMYFADKKPERVEKLIVVDISPKPSPSQLVAQTLRYVEFLKLAIEKIPPKVKCVEEAEKFLKDFFQPMIPQDEQSSKQNSTDGSSLPLRQGENGKFKSKSNLTAIRDSLLAPPTVMEDICKIPALIIYGTKSPYKVSDDLDFIRRVLPNCRFRAIEGANHQVHLEHEDIFLKEVTEFINDS